MTKRFSTTKRRSIVQLLADRDGPRCADCGVQPLDVMQLTVDHKDPTLRPPRRDALDNLRLLCRSDNGRRGALDRAAGVPGYGVSRVNTQRGTRERAGIDPVKLESDENVEIFEARAVAYVASKGGRAGYSDTVLVASYKLVRGQAAAGYMKSVVCPVGPLRVCPDDDTKVEIRPESDRWRFDG